VTVPAGADLLAAAVDADSAYFETEGHALLGRGVHRAWEVPQAELRSGWDEAADVLRGLARQGRRAVAFAALPFERDRPARVHVPERLSWHGLAGSAGSAGLDGSGRDDPAGRNRPAGVDRSAGLDGSGLGDPAGLNGPAEVDGSAGLDVARWEIRLAQTPRVWCDAVRAARARIVAGEAEKVVLARQIAVYRDVPFTPAPVLRRLRARFPSSHLFSLHGFVGASPELLVGRAGRELFASPLAGTTARSSDPVADGLARVRLLESAKLREEHRTLRDLVLATLADYCEELSVSPEPVVVSTPTVHHLASPVRGVLRPDAPGLLAIAATLHPTPAVCGLPRKAAYEMIRELEEERGRGLYGGAVGWLDADGDGRLAVAIRCVELDGGRAVVHVGNGIVAGSDPADELAETRAKMQGLLEAVVVP
jgi:isochorismate synthase